METRNRRSEEHTFEQILLRLEVSTLERKLLSVYLFTIYLVVQILALSLTPAHGGCPKGPPPHDSHLVCSLLQWKSRGVGTESRETCD